MDKASLVVEAMAWGLGALWPVVAAALVVPAAARHLHVLVLVASASRQQSKVP
jgi:hypothetical protein